METSCTLTRVVAYSGTQWALMQHNTRKRKRKRTHSEFWRAAGAHLEQHEWAASAPV